MEPRVHECSDTHGHKSLDKAMSSAKRTSVKSHPDNKRFQVAGSTIKVGQ